MFVREITDVETFKTNCKKLAAMSHLDVRGRENPLKILHRAYAISNDEKTKEIYDQWAL